MNQLELYTDTAFVTELYVGACERSDVELQSMGTALLVLIRYHDQKRLAAQQTDEVDLSNG
jgi:hypothetical protein